MIFSVRPGFFYYILIEYFFIFGCLPFLLGFVFYQQTKLNELKYIYSVLVGLFLVRFYFRFLGPVNILYQLSETIEDYDAQHRHEFLFHFFLQLMAERSLASVQQTAKRAGMSIGLIADLAVGMSTAGSYAWAHTEHVLASL